MSELPRPNTRQEQYLNAIATGNSDRLPTPITREEVYLNYIAVNGSGGDTKNYNVLSNKPKINNVELTGNKSASDLNLQNELTFDTQPTDNSSNPVTSNGVYSALLSKVDKETGKGLSTNDFTDSYKNQLDTLGTSSTKDYTDTFDEDGTEVTTGKAIADAINTEGVIDTPSQIMSFSDGSDSPMKSCTVSIEPIQDLHGYDAPWAGGAGKNKFNPLTVSVGYISDNDGAFHPRNNANCSDFIEVEPNTTYSISSAQTSAKWGAFYDSNKIYIGGISLSRGNWEHPTTPANAKYIRITVNYDDDNADFASNVQVEIGSTATAFAPYSNICPISGWDEVNVGVSGVNVWDEEWEVGTISTNTGANMTDSTRIRSKHYIPVIPNTDYYLRCSVNDGRLAYYDANQNFISIGADGFIGTHIFRTIPNARYIRFSPIASYGTTYNHDISINYPSTDTSYHAYNGQTITIDLDGTRYGGTLDVVSGVLTVTHGYVASYNGETLPSTWISDRDVYAEGTTPTIGAEVCYELATPYTVQLTPTQVRSLLGYNNVWSDSGEMKKIVYTKGSTTLSLTIADLYNIIANLDARVKELEGEDEVDLSTMSDEDLDEMPEEEEAEEVEEET